MLLLRRDYHVGTRDILGVKETEISAVET